MLARPLPLLLITALAAPSFGSEKLTFDQRVEIVRGLMAEYATAKTMLPRSKKALEFSSDGKWDRQKWDEAAKTLGPAARSGDLVQITKVTIEDKELVLEINGGMKGKSKWYEHVQIGMGTTTAPISQGQTNAPSGTTIALVFPKNVPPLQSSEFKKMLQPILDFEKHSATEQYVDTLPPEIKSAITQKKAIEGMDRDQVLMALGKPRSKDREVKDGLELEDWIYGDAPGKVTFVTFNGNKVIKVKEAYAGLGGSTAPTLPVR